MPLPYLRGRRCQTGGSAGIKLLEDDLLHSADGIKRTGQSYTALLGALGHRLRLLKRHLFDRILKRRAEAEVMRHNDQPACALACKEASVEKRDTRTKAVQRHSWSSVHSQSVSYRFRTRDESSSLPRGGWIIVSLFRCTHFADGSNGKGTRCIKRCCG